MPIKPIDNDRVFVLTEFKADRPPPMRERGIFAWLRTNIFCSWLDSFGTMIILYLLYMILPPTIDWMFLSAIWDAANATECHAKGTGACWAMIDRRMGQYIFGFYAESERWRVALAIFLFIALLLPILFAKPKIRKLFTKIIIFAYPFIAYEMYVGGFYFDKMPTSSFGGLMLTLLLSVVSISISLPLGILLALGRISNLPAIKFLCTFFIELARSAPLITILFMAQFMIPLFLPAGVTFDNLLRVSIGLTLFAAAYMAEVIRGGLQAIPSGQYEAADAMGLSYYRKMASIVLPQAMKISIPGIVNLFIGIFKDTTLVSIVGLFDFLLIVTASRRRYELAKP